MFKVKYLSALLRIPVNPRIIYHVLAENRLRDSLSSIPTQAHTLVRATASKLVGRNAICFGSSYGARSPSSQKQTSQRNITPQGSQGFLRRALAFFCVGHASINAQCLNFSKFLHCLVHQLHVDLHVLHLLASAARQPLLSGTKSRHSQKISENFGISKISKFFHVTNVSRAPWEPMDRIS